MSDSNPYAPPSVKETEANNNHYWQVDGIGILARNGALLPKVDLETGYQSDDMKCVPRVLQVAGAMGIARTMAGIGIYLAIKSFTNLEGPVIFVCLFAALFVLARLSQLRGSTNERLMVWEHIENGKLRGRRARRKLRIWAMFGAAFLYLLGMILAASAGASSAGGLAGALFIVLVLIIALAIWSVVDAPKVKSLAGPPGWMRISPVHETALALLRQLENERTPPDSTTQRKRLIRTTYYHRFPLRLLIGKKLTNPIFVLRVTLMKLLRSKHLVRETYHFSEAEKLPLDQLSATLRITVETWLGDHPDWIFIAGERLPSPAGDITLDSALLASESLEHAAVFHHVWAAQKSNSATSTVKFVSRSINGTSIWTQDHPYLNLNLPAIEEHRASGSPERVFKAHLHNCEGHMIRPAGSVSELQERLKKEVEEADRIMTDRGLQSETREAI